MLLATYYGQCHAELAGMPLRTDLSCPDVMQRALEHAQFASGLLNMIDIKQNLIPSAVTACMTMLSIRAYGSLCCKKVRLRKVCLCLLESSDAMPTSD